MAISPSYYFEKAERALAALSLSRDNFSRRVDQAALEFVRVPSSGLPPEIANKVQSILRKLIDRVPKLERMHGRDARIGNMTIAEMGRIEMNLGDMSWQKKKDLAEEIFIASIEIVHWSGRGTPC